MIIPSLNNVLSVQKARFLLNNANKQAFLILLGDELSKANIKVIHSDGDANGLIVQTALDECRNKSVTLIGEYTDLLVLALLHHNIIEHKHPMFLTCEAKANMVSSPDVWNIGETKKVIGEELCEALPLLHAISGCDTTSRIHSVGKPAVIQNFNSNKDFRRLAKIFACRSKPQCGVMTAGE